MQFLFSKIEKKVGFIKFDISPIKIVAFWKKKFLKCHVNFHLFFNILSILNQLFSIFLFDKNNRGQNKI